MTRHSSNAPVHNPTSASSGGSQTRLGRRFALPVSHGDIFGLLFEQSMDAIYIVAPDGTSIDANQAWLDLFGYTHDDLATLNAADVYANPADRETFLQRVAVSGYVEDEVRLKCKDGSILDCERTVIALKDDTGTLNAYQGIMRDITKRRRAEEALRASEARYRALFEHSLDMMLLTDLEGTIVDANPITVQKLGYPLDQLRGLPIWQHLSDDQRSIAAQMLAAIVATEKSPPPTEFRVRCSDGTELPTEVNAALVYREGSAIGIEVVARDITVRQQAEEQGRQQGIFADALMETSPACILVFGTDMKVVFANPETDRILGIPREHVTGMTCGKDFILLDLAGQAVPEEQLPMSRAALANRPMYSMEYAFDSPTGRRMLSISVAPLNDGFKPVSRVVATITDITDVKCRERELKQAVERLAKAMDATVDAMSAAIEMRDPYTAGHQLRVTVVARAIAKELGTNEDSVLALTVASRMHDLGKLHIPTEILTKPGRLTALELQMIREHPQATYDLLKGIDFPWPVAEIAHQHHERIDGSGYPQGLKGEEMLPEARILAVADVFEAMSSHRPYRAALGPEAALAELEHNRGTLYDAEAVDACVRLVREKGFTLD